MTFVHFEIPRSKIVEKRYVNLFERDYMTWLDYMLKCRAAKHENGAFSLLICCWRKLTWRLI